MAYEQTFLWSLLITLLAEVPVVFALVRHRYKKSNTGDTIFAGIIASALTLPYFWFVLPAFISERLPYVFLGESIIILVEAYIYHRLLKLSAKQAFVVSLCANLASIAVGVIVSPMRI